MQVKHRKEISDKDITHQKEVSLLQSLISKATS